ncbi:MarR family transcriptional regulator [Halosolutus halophilus]|uniref:MarR family transcriptional regulator n=1 Tax=Halosolutus halophilus TaxID=1552990 RepID=UPI002235069D|nr:MarR family transcriptional regulator [Halosolutus halophilus]
MSIELSETSEANELVVELNGELHADDLQNVIDQLNPAVEIRSFQIGIAADNPAALSVLSAEPEADAGLEETTDEGSERRSEHPDASAVDAKEDDSPDQSSVPQLQTDGDPFQIMRTIDTLDTWVRTKEIREGIPDEVDVATDSIGTNLWNLADRGLLEKRPYEEDKRQNEYRMTETGEAAFEQALEKSDESSSTDQTDE